jgi:hypothetical protein
LLYVEHFGLFSQALGHMRLCSVAPVPQCSVDGKPDAYLADNAADRLLDICVDRV